MSQVFEQGLAVLIGVGQAAYGPWSLPVTRRDAEALREVLVDPDRCGYPAQSGRVQLLSDDGATRAGILAALGKLGELAETTPNATAIVYFSGHGALDGDERYFLLPHDASPQALPDTALPAESLIEHLRAIRAQRLLVILDGCHSEGMAEAKDVAASRLPRGFSKRAPPIKLQQALAAGSGRAVLTSCRGSQVSWILPGHRLSLFTTHLVAALNGAGSPEGESLVRLSHLFGYVSAAVYKASETLPQAQTPFLKSETEDFPIALVRGGLGTRKKPAKEEVSEADSARGASPVRLMIDSHSVHGGDQSINLGGSGNRVSGGISYTTTRSNDQ